MLWQQAAGCSLMRTSADVGRERKACCVQGEDVPGLQVPGVSAVMAQQWPIFNTKKPWQGYLRQTVLYAVRIGVSPVSSISAAQAMRDFQQDESNEWLCCSQGEAMSNLERQRTSAARQCGAGPFTRLRIQRQLCCVQGGDVSHLNKPSISAVRAKQTTSSGNPALKLLQVLLPLLVILAAIFVPKYLL